MPLALGKSGSASHAVDPGEEIGVVDPAFICQDWPLGSESFVFPGGPDSLSLQTFQGTGDSKRHDEFSHDLHSSSSTDDLAMDDLEFLRPVDSASPLSGGEVTARENDIGKVVLKKYEPEPVVTSGLAWRRAKNRAAASKCRTKQKDRNKALQERFEESSAQNAYLKRQERVLRGLITSLRDCALQHDSARCGCKVLHAFNIKRAEHISRGMECLGSS